MHHSLLLSALAAFTLSLAPVAHGQGKSPQKKNLSLQGKKADEATMKKDAKAAAEAYYGALIAGDYKKASFFVHKDLVDGLRRELDRQLKSPKKNMKKQVLKAMGVASPAELSTMSDATLFARWASSPLGFKIAVMANPKAEAKADVENVYCYPKTSHCDVAMMLRANNQGGKVTTNRFMVRAEPDGGRWKLGANTGKTMKTVPVIPAKGQ